MLLDCFLYFFFLYVWGNGHLPSTGVTAISTCVHTGFSKPVSLALQEPSIGGSAAHPWHWVRPQSKAFGTHSRCFKTSPWPVITIPIVSFLNGPQKNSELSHKFSHVTRTMKLKISTVLHAAITSNSQRQTIHLHGRHSKPVGGAKSGGYFGTYARD